MRFTWGGGFLRDFHDFAGSGVVHLQGGVAALAGAYAVGPRMGRWDATMLGDFVPHNIPSVISGTLLLFVAWFAFNAGSTGGMSSIEHSQAAAAPRHRCVVR